MLKEKIKQFNFKQTVLGEQVSQILTEAILEGVFKGGDRLVESELQRAFDISRSPLREAFRDLEKKGLVVISPRKGTSVRRITRKDIEENFPIRSNLEGLAAKNAFAHMTLKARNSLGRALENMERAVRSKDATAYWKSHIAFHEIFIAASGNEALINILKTLRMHSMWYRFSYQYYREDLGKSLAVHQKIFEMFDNPQTNASELGSLVQHHIEVASERFLAYLEAQKD